MPHRAAAIFAGLLLPWLAHAQGNPFTNALKRDDPDALAVTVAVSENCGLTEQRVIETVRGVLIRSRIKPLDFDTSPGYFRLDVVVNCLQNKTAFTVKADFVDVWAARTVRYDDGFGTFGTFGGDAQYLLDAVRTTTERAITEYLQANFDLAPE